MFRFYLSVTCVLVMMSLSLGDPLAQNKTSRQPKLFSLFQVVTFQNGQCTGTTRNGTCFTANECTNRGGTTSGTCASGYGVCCILAVGCGSRSSENNTYLTQTSSAGITLCSYTICKSQSDICRIRFDLTTFSIASPVEGIIGNTNTAGGAIGDCTMDQFSVTNPDGAGSPIICGFNTGQHMIVDASDQCHEAAFNFGASAMTARTWDIKVTQFTCTEEMGGPEGCLQYFTSVSGTFSSFNFPTSSSAVSSTATHLSNQEYKICIRRNAEYCAICYVPNFANAITAVIATSQAGFGLSSAAINSDVGTQCSEDYLTIPGAFDLKGGETLATVAPAPTQERICGRTLSAITDQSPAMIYDTAIAAMMASVCTRNTPFVVSFKSDDNEIMMEEMAAPAGIIGFSLNYQQIKC